MNKLKHLLVKSLLKQRKIDTSKRDYGHALIIAGGKGCMGAAIIASKACLKSGVGLLSVCVPYDERTILQIAIPEAMLIMRDSYKNLLKRYSAIGIGPGLGTAKASQELLSDVLNSFKKPMVLDADALNIIASNQMLFKKILPDTIITPHQAEFDRLFGVHKNQEERIAKAIEKAKKHDIIIVLKSHQTAIIAPNETYYNTTGNTGLAKGGSGDALTGMITSFLAQGYLPLNAAKLAVYMHGLAADITLKKQSMESMLISEVIHNLGKAFKKIQA